MGVKIVLGLGGTVDYELVWDSHAIAARAAELRVHLGDAQDHKIIHSERELYESILWFLLQGHGGERFVADKDVLFSLADRLSFRVTLGGSCVRAAIGLDKLGIASTVHLVSVDDHVRRLLPERVKQICSATEDSTEPHMIVQYPLGAQVNLPDGAIETSTSNRLIYVNDLPNRELLLSSELGQELATADVFLISGFNSMDDEDTVRARASELAQAISYLPSSAIVFYEDAGFHHRTLRTVVNEALRGTMDIFSLNEDEVRSYLGVALDPSDPVATERAVQELARHIESPIIVLHTRHWALAYGEHADRMATALQYGQALAATRYLYGDNFTEQQFRTVLESPRNAVGSRVKAQLEQNPRICCVPAFDVSTPSPTTIGLGDTFVGGFIAGMIESGLTVNK